MHSKLLVDAIVRQTTIVIAQLCTAAGVRGPLAQVADQVFLGLAQEIEAQGVSRKVAADMFGLALRSYQKKVQRLNESATFRERTLWEAVLDFLRDQGTVSRQRIFQRFSADDEEALAAVLADLVSTGLAYATGRGVTALYGLTSAEDQALLAAGENAEALAAMAWLCIYRQGPLDAPTLYAELRVSEEAGQLALAELEREGRVERDPSGLLRASAVHIPVGATSGWEAAVFDHYQALCKAIAAKVRLGPRSLDSDRIGGATLTFHVHPGHPLEARVYGLLREIRAELNTLWQEVVAHNRAHPVEEDGKAKVTFYFGQNVERAETEAAEAAPSSAPADAK
jgi:hypothetical protein